MDLNELQALLQELLQAIDALYQSGEQLSDEEMGFVAQTMDSILNRIDEAEALTTPETPPLTPSMPSSNVEGFAYDDKNNRLFVRFLGQYPNKNGPVYSYDGVPKVIFDLFQSGSVPARTDGKNKWGQWWKGKVPSIGASLYTLIKNGGYQYQRMS